MTSGQLKTLIAVVDAGSIKGAAQKLVVTQAAVSSAIAGLQDDLGVRLFDRDGRGIRVNPAGLRLYGYAQTILGLIEEAKEATLAEAEPDRAILRLAAVTTAGEVLVPIWLRDYLVEHPTLRVNLEVGNRERVFELLTSHRVDLVVGGRPPNRGGMVSLARRPHELVLICDAQHLNQVDQITREGDSDPGAVRDWLDSVTWLIREHGSGTRETAEELMAALGITPKQLTIGSNGAIVDATEVGLGIALVSRDAVRRQIREGSLGYIEVAPLPLVRDWHLIARDTEELPHPMQLFLDYLVESGQVSITPQLPRSVEQTHALDY